jgi:hypothetical protein
MCTEAHARFYFIAYHVTYLHHTMFISRPALFCSHIPCATVPLSPTPPALSYGCQPHPRQEERGRGWQRHRNACAHLTSPHSRGIGARGLQGRERAAARKEKRRANESKVPDGAALPAKATSTSADLCQLTRVVLRGRRGGLQGKARRGSWSDLKPPSRSGF